LENVKVHLKSSWRNPIIVMVVLMYQGLCCGVAHASADSEAVTIRGNAVMDGRFVAMAVGYQPNDGRYVSESSKKGDIIEICST
jgi:hypothetical protein